MEIAAKETVKGVRYRLSDAIGEIGGTVLQ
jgi:hypothetical protein